MRAILQQLCEEVIKRYEENLKNDAAAKEVQTIQAAELEIEEFKQTLGQRMMESYTEIRSQQAAEQKKDCQCGNPLPVHQWTNWKHGTLHADMEIKDPYKYCRKCHQSQRPLHGLLGIEPERWSLEVQRVVVDFGSDHGFGKSEEKMKEHYPKTPIGKSSIRSIALRHGEKVFKHLEEKLSVAAEQALQRPWLRGGVEYLEVEYDGSLIRTGVLKSIQWQGVEPKVTAVRGHPKRQRESEWKQVNLGVVHERGKVEGLYSGRFGNSEAAFDDLFGLACLAGWSLNTDTTGIADGAPHIRSNLEDRFTVLCPDFVQVTGPSQSKFQFILDRVHAKEHLVQAGEILGPKQNKRAQEWADEKIQLLDKGQVADVIAQLKRAAKRLDNDTLRQQAQYFAKNQDAVDYDRFKAEGRSIGSGRVESGHNHVIQDRMKLPGTWWHPDNVDPMVALRILRVNHWWDEYWKEQQSLYQKKAEQLRKKHLPWAA